MTDRKYKYKTTHRLIDIFEARGFVTVKVDEVAGVAEMVCRGVAMTVIAPHLRGEDPFTEAKGPGVAARAIARLGR